jgi:hypothetical protein
MTTFIHLNMIEAGYNEDTGTAEEGSRPVTVNGSCIRAFYARRHDRPGSRITFNDGGGFAVKETPDVIAEALGSRQVAAS